MSAVAQLDVTVLDRNITTVVIVKTFEAKETVDYGQCSLQLTSYRLILRY